MKKSATIFLACITVFMIQGVQAQTNIVLPVVEPDCASIENVQDISSLNIYPNPSSGEFNLHIVFTQKVNELGVRVFDVSGKEVMTRRYTEPSLEVKDLFDLSSLSPGSYMMKINIDGIQLTRQLIRK